MLAEIENQSNGVIYPKKGNSPVVPYQHQNDALKALDRIDKKDHYSTLVVLPTGGGKTYTAATWLLKNALDKREKILWIAHRQMLLEQAADSFKTYAYAERIPHLTSFSYRIISGASNHDRAIDIDPSDSLLIASKDSVGRNLERLDAWLENEDTVFLVIDEAHHATAKTYRRIIDYVKERVHSVKLIGLTATPFRTADSEQGLLKKIFTDDISYQISLKALINKGILSKPYLESYETESSFGEDIGISDWESIQQFDKIPDAIAEEMAKNKERNHLIVNVYKKNRKKYGQTIVFAVNITHAIALAALFKKEGIAADYVVSAVKDMMTGATVSQRENEEKLEAYRRGDLEVLVNVNILTEGADFPKTKTVFLARPTISTILMTQMVGRALRGERAGGTKDAYIVSFVDDWDEHISWASPDRLFSMEGEFNDSPTDRKSRELRMIAISKIEEFASILDSSIDTTELEAVPFTKRIPIGMYAFTYLEESGMDVSYQVMVYDSTARAYKEMMNSLPDLFENYGTDDEYLSSETLSKLERQCYDTFFLGKMIPPYDSKDIRNILKYYALKSSAPQFYTFDDIDRDALDVSKIAKHIYDENMGIRDKTEYLNEIWESHDNNMLRLFFGRKLYFLKLIDSEILKIADFGIFDEADNVKYGRKSLEAMPLYDIRKYDPEYEKQLRNKVFKKAKDKNGYYCCAICGRKSKKKVTFQVDHIIPMNQGGKSVEDNLQILCRTCNSKKGDR